MDVRLDWCHADTIMLTYLLTASQIRGISEDARLDWCHAETVMLPYLLKACQISGISVDGRFNWCHADTVKLPYLLTAQPNQWYFSGWKIELLVMLTPFEASISSDCPAKSVVFQWMED